MHEIAPQMHLLGIQGATILHAASSAGTTAGMVRGAGELDLDIEIVGSSVGEPGGVVVERIEALLVDADRRFGAVESAVPWRIIDDYIGLGYGLTTPDELATQAEATRLTGMLFDPAYTGKVVYALKQEISAGRMSPNGDVIFWHTGGGFAAFAHPELLRAEVAE